MKKPTSFLVLPVTAVVTVFAGFAYLTLTGCDYDPAQQAMNRAATFGEGQNLTEFKLASEDGVTLRDDQLAKAGDIIRRYKRLNRSEQEIIQKLVQTSFDGFVVEEMERLKPKFEPRISKVEKSKDQQLAQIRRNAKAEVAKAATEQEKKRIENAVEDQVAEVENEAQNEIQQIREEWRETALAAAANRYGSDFAVPLDTPDDQPVVALASIQDGTATVKPDAFTVGARPTDLAKVSFEREDYAVLTETASISSP